MKNITKQNIAETIGGILFIGFILYIVYGGLILPPLHMRAVKEACNKACYPYQAVMCMDKDYNMIYPGKGKAQAACSGNNNSTRVVDIIIE